MNIFTSALGLLAVKFALVGLELFGRKENP